MDASIEWVWMAVTADKYELPLAVAISIRELGTLMGIDDSNICYLKKSNGTSARKFNGYKYKIRKVNVAEDSVF